MIDSYRALRTSISANRNVSTIEASTFFLATARTEQISFNQEEILRKRTDKLIVGCRDVCNAIFLQDWFTFDILLLSNQEHKAFCF